MSKTKVLIIAPHADDEVIGCWSVLTNPEYDVTVLYLYELTVERKLEAEHAASGGRFTPVFMAADGKCVLGDGLNIPSFDQVYVPSRRDWHADHQRANREYRQFATHFYSVDMARGTLLATALAKKVCLDECYPSQAALWAHNDKYWLFEDIQAYDYDVYVKIQIEDTDTWVTVLKEHAYWVRGHWAPYVAFIGDEVDIKDVNRLLAHCSGRVTIEGPDYLLEA